MSSLTSALVALTLLLTGSYAGMALMCQIGVLPAMRKLSLQAYAEAWRAMDSFLDRSMPPFKLTLLLANAAAVACLARDHRTRFALFASASFVLSLLGLVLTITRQLPINRQLKALPAGNSDDILLRLREQTVRNFSVRFVLAMCAFALLILGTVF